MIEQASGVPVSTPALQFLRFWRSSSMGTQLMALLVVSILAAHALAVGLMQFNTDTLNPVSRDEALERMAIAYQVLRVTPAAQQNVQLAAFSLGRAQFWIGARPEIRPGQASEELRIAALLRRLLPDDGAAVRIVLSAGPDEPGHVSYDSMHAGPAWSRMVLSIAVPLADGRWLHSRQLPLAKYQWWRRIGFSMPLSILAVLLVVVLFMRLILRPLDRLAHIAERLSRGEHVEALPVVGPRETREVYMAFSMMQSRLLRYVADRTGMLAAISHDFRSPITALRLRLEMIEEGEHREAMRRTLLDLQAMVEETLRFTRDDAVSEPSERIDLAALVEHMVAERVELGEPVRHLIAPESLRPMIVGRRLSLRRALSNLIDNAVRHGGSAELRLEPAATQGFLHICVQDRGPGMPPELLERVFEPFFQVESSLYPHNGGVGLGLSIARSCIHAHGGQVSLNLREGGGLQASVLLPI